MPPPSNYPIFPQFPPKFEDPHKSQWLQIYLLNI
jgi:hypothetical protein